jgi:hypothetical protein
VALVYLWRKDLEPTQERMGGVSSNNSVRELALRSYWRGYKIEMRNLRVEEKEWREVCLSR